MTFINQLKVDITAVIYERAAFARVSHTASGHADSTGRETAGSGSIKGLVRDDAGNPIADATVAIFRVGTSKLLKQVRFGVGRKLFRKDTAGNIYGPCGRQGF